MKIKEHYILAFLPMLYLLVVLSSCSSEYDGGTNVSQSRISFLVSSSSSYNGGRSTLTDDFNNSVGIFGFSYDGTWTDSNTPNLMWNEMITPLKDHWITEDAFPIDNLKLQTLNMRYYAYYPYINFEEETDPYLSITSKTIAGIPYLNYTVPNDVENQYDIRVGNSTEKVMADILTPSTIEMAHKMTAIKFINGDITSGTIKSITLSKIHNKGEIYAEKTATWALDENSYDNYTINLNKALTSTSVGTLLNDDDQILLMMPQTLANASKMTMVYNDGQDHTLTVSMKGLTWLEGKVVTYTISLKSLERMHVSASIVDWGDEYSVTGEVSDASSIQPGTVIVDWESESNINN
jgi:hypothetical protein